MKHPSSREFFAYWDARRDGRAAPERNDMEPGPIRALLGDIFVLSYDPAGGYPFRVAGTRVCALLGRDLKGEALADLFTSAARPEIEDVLGVVAEEKLAAVAGVTAASRGGSRIPLELLLLPFNTRAHTPISLTGMLVPFRDDAREVSDFTLGSWRYMGHQPQRLGPRVLRKLAIARGLMVYEGLI
jgi:hypothetical protein